MLKSNHHKKITIWLKEWLKKFINLVLKNSIISCFNPECIRQVKEIDKDIKTALLYEDDELGNEIMTFGVAKYCQQLNADAAHPHRNLITHKEILELHNLGIAVNPDSQHS